MLVGSPKSAGRGRSESESRVSSAGRAVYHPNAQGGMALFAHAAGSYRCASWCQVETAWSRPVRGVGLAPDRSQGLRGGMRRMGATCADAQTHMHPQRITSQEYDQNGAESGGGDALPSEWRPCASQRPIASIAGGGSARFRLLTCGRRSSTRSPPKSARFSGHMSGKRRSSARRPKVGIVRRDGSQKKGKSGGRRYMWVSAAEARSFCTEDPAGRVVPTTGEYRVAPGERGEGPRHLASAQKSQHNYPAKAVRAVGRGVGRVEPLAPAFQLSPSDRH
jgi:hypothetical protein